MLHLPSEQCFDDLRFSRSIDSGEDLAILFEYGSVPRQDCPVVSLTKRRSVPAEHADLTRDLSGDARLELAISCFAAQTRAAGVEPAGDADVRALTACHLSVPPAGNACPPPPFRRRSWSRFAAKCFKSGPAQASLSIG